ncbi:MAG: HNH endonuclease signature motif containing protein [Chloroflexota bacterium]
MTEDARYRYGYCSTSQAIVAIPMYVEHIIPVKAGGETAVENL